MNKIGSVLIEAVKSFFKKPVTSDYPKQKRKIHESFAGMIDFVPEKCVGCQLCVKNCPSNAIKIIKVADKMFRCELSLAKCIFCCQCVYSCNKKALRVTSSFELAQIDKSKLSVVFEPKPSETKFPETESPETKSLETESPETKFPEPKAQEPEPEVQESKIPEPEVPESAISEPKAPESVIPELKAPEIQAQPAQEEPKPEQQELLSEPEPSKDN